MSRKDTILIAVLVNMALLVVVFVWSLKPADTIAIAAKSKKNGEMIAVLKPSESQSSSIDQVDQILSKYVEKEKVVVEESTPTSTTLATVDIPKPVVQKAIMQGKSDPRPSYKEVIVKQGDMLEKIARNHHTTVSEIMRVNKMSSTRLQIGQILYVPVSGGVANGILKPSLDQSSPKYYEVKNGENPWTIAIKNGIKVEELLKLNGLNEAKAKRLKPGDRLRIQ